MGTTRFRIGDRIFLVNVVPKRRVPMLAVGEKRWMLHARTDLDTDLQESRVEIHSPVPGLSLFELQSYHGVDVLHKVL